MCLDVPDSHLSERLPTKPLPSLFIITISHWNRSRITSMGNVVLYIVVNSLFVWSYLLVLPFLPFFCVNYAFDSLINVVPNLFICC